MTGEEEFQAKYGIGFDAAHAQESEYDPDSDFIRDLRRSCLLYTSDAADE